MDRDRKGGLDDTIDATNAGTAPTVATAVDSGAPTLATQAPEGTAPSSGAIGEMLSTRYRLGPVIGRGGMGEIVSAHDEQIGRSVAIKRMRAVDPPADAVARFLREARVQGRLEHPAVVPVHELWHDEQGRPFFAMKQLAGTTLADVIVKLAAGDRETIEKFSRQRLLRAFAEICLAVEFAHTRGVIHRDLKPANIMLGEFGEVFVLDWGIARVAADLPEGRASFADIDTLESATVAGALLGTPGYMSPEQVGGEPDLDGRSDVYALGAILFEILALEPLHERGRAGLASTLVGAEARPSVRVAARETPPELDAICVAATMTDRGDRSPSARALGDAVQRYLDGDRDVALRKELARNEMEIARSALERGRGEGDRRDAFRAAGRALALDPTDREPADLVARLMLEPPTETPREVEAELEEIELDALYASRRLNLIASAATMAFLPVLVWAGFRGTYLLTSGIVITVAGLAAWLSKRRTSMVGARIAFAGYVVMIAMVSRMITPFLIAPCVAAVTAMTIATHPKIVRPALLVVIMLGAVLGPWVLEVLGVLSTTTRFVGDTLVLTPMATALDPLGATCCLVGYVVVVSLMSVVLSYSLANQRRATQRVVQIQSWQLRQLVPRAATSR